MGAPMSSIRNTNINASNMREFASTAAYFSLITYKEEALNVVPANYHLLATCPSKLQKENYYGESYYTVSSNNAVTVFIAHRGSVYSYHDIESDFWIYEGKTPSSFNEGAMPFVDHVTQTAKEKFPNQPIVFVHTGHSLGSIHAELAYAYQNSKITDPIFAISFENPGSKPIMEDAISRGYVRKDALSLTEHVEIYNTDANAINTCNPHFKAPNWINVGYQFNATIDEMPTDYTYFITTFTPSQHSIINIVNKFDANTVVYDKKEYPNGRSKAYDFYLTYDINPVHQDYWDKAIADYWDKHQKIHSKYNNNFAAFKQEMIDTKLTRVSQFGMFANKQSTRDDEINNLMNEFVVLDVKPVNKPVVHECSMM